MSWFCLLYLSGHHIKGQSAAPGTGCGLRWLSCEKPAVTVTAEVSKAYLCAGRLQV